MKQHRVRTAPSVDSNSKDHFFVEVELDEWVEVSSIPNKGHEAIHRYLDKEEKLDIKDMRLATRYFMFIKGWKEAGIVYDDDVILPIVI